jgi:hypothetical protein
MLGKIKNKGTDFVLKLKGLFTSSESNTTYVKDLRKVIIHKGRNCQYPKNYNELVKSGKIIRKQEKDSNGEPVKDENGNPKYQYKLLYGPKDKNGEQPRFKLALVKKDDDKSYFTIDFLLHPEGNDYSGYYKPFGFSRVDLVEYIPVFEVDTKSLRLTNSSVIGKKGFKPNDKGEFEQEDRDEKGRNGKLLYTSDYKKLNTSFFEIRNQNGNLEKDKSLISVPLVFAAGLAKVAAGVLTYLPMKLGEYLLSKQNPIAKGLGYILFTPAAVVKNLVNIGSTILKAPILLFVANKEKYGDAYFTMSKHQLNECWKEIKSDFEVVKNGEKTEQEQNVYPEKHLVGTWDELNARKPIIEKELEEKKNKEADETLRSQNESLGSEVVKKLEAAVSEEEIKALHKELPIQTSTNHANRYEQKKAASHVMLPQK